MKKLNVISLAALLIAGNLLLSASCNNKNSNNQNQNDNLSINADHAKDSMDQEVADFKKNWNEKVDQMDNQIDQWQDKIKSYSGQKKEQAQVKLDSLKVQRDRLKDKIDHASDHAGTQWDKFKEGVSDSYNSLSTKIKSIFND